MLHSPTLKTIRLVEDTLKESDSLITIPQLKKILPRQINHNTLKEILSYLEESNKVYCSVKGITWVGNPNPLLSRIVNDSKVM